MKPRPKSRARGFTLIEVLVAVAIVAVALAAGIRASGSLLNNAQRLADVSSAQWCAENHLVNLRLTRHFPDIGETQRSCEQLGQSYTLKIQVRASFNPNFRIVDVGVADPQAQSLIRLSAIIPRY